jgi:hypothetical protein
VVRRAWREDGQQACMEGVWWGVHASALLNTFTWILAAVLSENSALYEDMLSYYEVPKSIWLSSPIQWKQSKNEYYDFVNISPEYISPDA